MLVSYTKSLKKKKDFKIARHVDISLISPGIIYGSWWKIAIYVAAILWVSTEVGLLGLGGGMRSTGCSF